MPPRTRRDEVTEAGEKRAAAAASGEPVAPPSGLVAALLEERRGYVVRGLSDRAAAVDEQLAAHGYAAKEQ